MSLLTKYILPQLEAELSNYEPQIKELSENELKDIIIILVDYLAQKLDLKKK